MKRTAFNDLKEWKNNPKRKPLLITGVRQCGKTYLIRDFGEEEFEHTAYFNFETDPLLSSVFNYNFDTRRIINELGVLKDGKMIDPTTTLIVFDEIQECPQAVTSLKYFCESDEDYYLICAGSLLGVEVRRQKISFPVGKIQRLQLYPMSFYEFLLASDAENLCEMLREYDPSREIPEAATTQMLRYLKQYYVVGGMPYVVSQWIESGDYRVVDAELDTILMDYRDDFSKHADPKDIPRLSQIWDSIPQQLARENNKFVFSHVKKGVRARDLEDALQWLVDAGLVYKLEKVSTPQLPLTSMADGTCFKIYMSDVGLLRRCAGLSYQTVITEPEEYKNFKGAFAENYVMTEFVASHRKVFYWRSGNTAEVDFLLEDKTRIIPVEVKAAEHTRAKSFITYCRQYHPSLGFRVSTKNIGENLKEQTKEVQLPLYLLWLLDRYL